MVSALANRSTMLRYTPIQLGVLFLVCVVEVCAQEAPRGPGAGIQPGFLIVGPSGKRDFELRAGDTLPELRAGAVPKQVVRAATRQAMEYHFSPACTRYFRTTGRYVALLVKSCKPDDVVE